MNLTPALAAHPPDMRLPYFFFALVFLAPATLLRADLVFATTEQALTARSGEPFVSTSYEFKNDGSTEITVDEVASSCGCTVPLLEKKRYAPGEKGVLTVRYDLGDRQGRNEGSILVKTATGVTRLKLTVNILPRAEISSKLVLFRKTDGEKSSTIRFQTDLPVVITAVTVSDPAFTVSTIDETPGELYRLAIRLSEPPKETVRATVTVTSRGMSGKIYTDIFHLRYLP